ncbi:unnamed protein product, partial [Allacma fusca]
MECTHARTRFYKSSTYLSTNRTTASSLGPALWMLLIRPHLSTLNAIQSLNRTINNNQDAIRSLVSQNDILLTNNTNLQRDVQELESQVQKLNSANVELNDRISTLASTLRH